MKEIELRILDMLSREMGNPISIRSLKEKINEVYGHAHYPMIYNTIQKMAERKLVNLDKHGKSSAASLNFANPLLADGLAQMEIVKKIHFLEQRKEWQTLGLQINGYLEDFSSIRSITMIRPVKYAKLNRMELLILLKIEERRRRKETENIQDIMQLLERVHNIRIDFLLLDEDSFRDLLKSEDANMIREILSDKITIFYPQTFWFLIKKFIDEGLHIKSEEMIDPAKISEKDIAYNLNRFGYQEFGTKISAGRNIGTEYIITSILLEGDARKRNAIPIILAKRSKETNYDLLMFLSKKYATLENLFPYLKILYDVRPSDKLRECIHALKRSGISEAKIDTADIRKKMRLYNVE